MNASAPEWLRAQVRAHNTQAVGLVVLSLLAAVIVWSLAYFFFMLILMGFLTSIHGIDDIQLPAWLPFIALGLAVALFTWGTIDHLRQRFEGTPERPIIGWHLFGEFLLLPVRLTFAVWGNLSAVLWLNDTELAGAWELVVTIQRSGKVQLSALTLIEPEPDRLYRLVHALQLLSIIDLHRSEDGWYYTVRSPHWEELGKLLVESEQRH